MYSADSLTPNSWPTAPELMSEQSLPNTCIFSTRQVSLPALGNTGQYFSTVPGGHFKQQNHQQKEKKNKSKTHGTK